jgi:hypothetical protein
MINSSIKKPVIFGLILLICIVSAALFLIWSWKLYRVGFPLDDAWIHQTYARNFGVSGQWVYFPGQPSAGSTSPLWTFVLAVGYLLRFNQFLWAIGVGLFILAILAYIGYRYLLDYLKIPNSFAWLAAILLVFEYHLVWAALSGMETLLFGLILTIILLEISRENLNPLPMGLLIGICIWIRPDGLTLLGPALLYLFISPVQHQRILQNLAVFAAGFLLLIIPYLVFNDQLAGSIWPSTFYAKQAEYAVLRQAPLVKRLITEFSLPLIGAGILLLPGFIYFIVHEMRGRKWCSLLGVIWWMGYIGLYALRLPVTYQHGRYIIPAMPLYFIWGIAGTALLVSQPSSRPIRIISRTWLVSIFVVLIGFWVLGGRAYAYDVAIIESEMVDTAYWISENTPTDSLIAAHDIGALGYFGERQIFDLAGLVSPQVIPVITNEGSLIQMINDSGAAYLMTFPDWYERLASCGEIVYDTNAPYSPGLGGENMSVYQWKDNCTIH